MDPGSTASEAHKQQQRDRQLSSTPNILLSNPQEEEEPSNQTSIQESRGGEDPGMSTMTVPSSPPRLVRQPSINQGYSVINPKASRQESKGGLNSPTLRSAPGVDWHTMTNEDFPG